MIYTFDEFELDEHRFELRHAGAVVKVEPKVLDVLRYLVAHRSRMVPKGELFEKLWPGEFVSDSALTYCIKEARRVLGDDGTQQRFIKTHHGRGYRFVAAVREAGTVAAATPPDGAAAPRQGATVFVGREREMDTLTGGLDEVFRGNGRLFLLVGEPGIGKTRTADEVAAIAQARSATVLVGRCYEGDGAPAFWPWVQIVRAYVRQRDAATLSAVMGAGAADICQVVPEVCERLQDVPAAPALQPEQARFRLFDSIATFLRNAGSRQPLALILDDLHWADQPSLLLLQFVAREIGDARVFVAGTYRDLQLGRQHPLTQTLGELARIPICQRIPLQGLAEPDVARFMESAAGRSAPDLLVAAVHRETDGNPFFVTEIVRLLVAEGGWDGPEDALSRKLTIPQTVREAIARRLRGLSAVSHRTLQVAAVIGREFDVATLQQVRKSSADARKSGALLQLLDEAVAARVIEPWPPAVGRYRFSHALIRESLYDELTATDRVRHHRGVGEALEALWRGDVAPHLAVLAHHFLQAAPGGGVGKAIDYAVRAGERATRLLAYEAAAQHYENALRLLAVGQSDALRRSEILLALGDNQWRAGNTSQARDAFEHAADVARQLEAPEQFARAALGVGGGFRGFELGVVEPVLVELLEEALRRLGTGDSALRVQVLARLAVALYHVPNSLDRRAALSQEAVDMAGRMGDDAAQLAALYSRHWAIWGPDNLDDRFGAADEMVRLAAKLDAKEMALHAHRFRLIDALEVGAIDAVDRDLAACAGLADELRQPYYSWYVESYRAMRAFLDGRFAESERLAHHAAAVGQRAQSRNVSQLLGTQLFVLRREQGRLAELEAATRGFVAQYPTLPVWRCALAYICAELGHEADARAQFEVLATDDFAAVPRDAFWLSGMVILADVCVFLGDARGAATLLRVLAPYAGRNVILSLGGSCTGSAARALGRLATLLGRWREATEYFDAALRMNGRIGAPHAVAHTEEEYAEMLLCRGHPDDRDRALDLLGRAADTYQRLGMPTFLARSLAGRERAEAMPAGSRKAGNDRLRAHSRVAPMRRR